jgi:DNA-binding LacI/PurR family transcriptional regulator
MSQLPFAHEEIKRRVLDGLGSRWPVGTRLPPIVDLARVLKAGQRSTVRAVRELADEGYLQSRRRRGTFVAAAPLERSTTPEVGLRGKIALVGAPQQRFNPFLQALIDPFVARVEASGFRCDSVNEDRYDLTLAAYRGFEAVALFQPGPTPIRADPSCPLVVISTTSRVHVSEATGYDIVAPDEEQGAALAGVTLRAAGAKIAAFVGMRQAARSSAYEPISSARLRGFETGWGEPVARSHLLFGKAFGEASGARCVADFLALCPRPDAVFCASDDLAIGFAMGVLAVGLKLGDDVQLMGFDAQPRGRAMLDCPQLTSVAVPLAEMGRRGAELLMARLAHRARGVERVLLGCSVQVGGTVCVPEPVG